MKRFFLLILEKKNDEENFIKNEFLENEGYNNISNRIVSGTDSNQENKNPNIKNSEINVLHDINFQQNNFVENKDLENKIDLNNKSSNLIGNFDKLADLPKNIQNFPEKIDILQNPSKNSNFINLNQFVSNPLFENNDEEDSLFNNKVLI